MTDGIVNIHGKQYMTVAKRVEDWLAENKANNDGYSIETEVLNHVPVVVKATVKYKNRIFTGISAANPSKTLGKQSPYEIAETSAVGRALGFAGFGVIEGIASADEMIKAGATEAPKTTEPKKSMTVEEYENRDKCDKCGSAMGVSQKGNKYCLAKCWLNPKPSTSQEDDNFPLEQ